MVKIYPDCPRDENEFDSLVYVLIDNRFSDPEQYKEQVREEVRVLRKKGKPDEQIRLYQRIEELLLENQEAYELMLRWGENQRQSQTNFMMHITSGCKSCLEHYAHIVVARAIDLAEEDGVNLENDQKQLDCFVNRAHEELLGSINFGGRKLSLKKMLSDIL